MKYEVRQSRLYYEEWHVEAIGKDGEVYVAIFAGPLAEQRARDYKVLVEQLPGTILGVCEDTAAWRAS